MNRNFQIINGGVRNQLIQKKSRKLVSDYIVQGDKLSTHILNVVAPGYTCCIPFSEYVCKIVSQNLGYPPPYLGVEKISSS